MADVTITPKALPSPTIVPSVNSRDGKGVFWANFIQISEVHADLPLPTLLLNHQSVGQPLGIKDLLNCFSLFQLVYLYPCCLGVIFG